MQAERRQILAGVAPLQQVLVVRIVEVGEHVFVAIPVEARAAEDVAVAVVDGHDADAVRTLDVSR